MNVVACVRRSSPGSRSPATRRSAFASATSSPVLRPPSAGHPGRATSIVRIDGERYSAHSAHEFACSRELRDSAGQTVVLGGQARDGTPRWTSRPRCGLRLRSTTARVRSGSADGDPARWSHGRRRTGSTYSVRCGARSGVERTVSAGSGSSSTASANLVGSIVAGPDRSHRRSRARSASRPRSATSSGQRPDHDAVRCRASCRPTWPSSTSCRSRRSMAAGC